MKEIYQFVSRRVAEASVQPMKFGNSEICLNIGVPFKISVAGEPHNGSIKAGLRTHQLIGQIIKIDTKTIQAIDSQNDRNICRHYVDMSQQFPRGKLICAVPLEYSLPIPNRISLEVILSMDGVMPINLQ